MNLAKKEITCQLESMNGVSFEADRMVLVLAQGPGDSQPNASSLRGLAAVGLSKDGMIALPSLEHGTFVEELGYDGGGQFLAGQELELVRSLSTQYIPAVDDLHALFPCIADQRR